MVLTVRSGSVVLGSDSANAAPIKERKLSERMNAQMLMYGPELCTIGIRRNTVLTFCDFNFVTLATG